MGHGYPINNIGRLQEAVRVWEKACRRFKHFKRNVKMRKESWGKDYNQKRYETEIQN